MFNGFCFHIVSNVSYSTAYVCVGFTNGDVQVTVRYCTGGFHEDLWNLKDLYQITENAIYKFSG